MATPRRARLEAVGANASVTPLELFFDLVFVFALTQVTALMARGETVTATALLQGALIVVVMWWCWVGYSWLANVVRADEGAMRVAIFVAMAIMFVIAITIPEAFDDLPGGLQGPVVFAVGYFLFRLVHLLVFLVVSRGDRAFRRQVVRFSVAMVGGTVLLLVASQTTGWVQILLWVAALAVDYGGTVLSGTDWRINSPGHFAERHGLIIIVALGESIVSIGIGIADLPISWPIIIGSAFGLAVSIALWWAYFDVSSLVAERAFAAAEGTRLIRLARDGYSFLHLPMVVGIIMMSLGLKKALNYISGVDGHTLADPLYGAPLAALYGGAALYLLAHVWFKIVMVGSVNVARIVVAVLLVALVPAGPLLPAMASLGLLAAVLGALMAWETHRFAEQRHRIRHEEHG